MQIFRDNKMNKVLTFLNKANSDSLEILKSMGWKPEFESELYLDWINK